jgi:hypothetical protein
LTQRGSDPLTNTKDCKKEWEKRDREEVTVEKAATLEAAEEVVEEVMAEAAEEEATDAAQAAAVAVAAEVMTAVMIATAGRIETGDPRLSKKVKK